MAWPTQQGIFDAGDLTLQSGAVLRGARLSWKAHGTLSPARDNVIVYPTSYGAQHPDLEWLIGPDGVLDPTRWFIVILDMFGNGLSSSPSNTADYPSLVTIFDNVQTQRRALRELFGIERVACVYGWSMGALQAYHWAALFPDAVDRIVVNCGVARTAVHNQVFLRSLMATLEAAPEHTRRRPLLGRAARRQAGIRTHLCGVGAQPGLLSRRTASGVRATAQSRRTRPRDVPPHRLGGPLRCAPRRQPVCAASDLGCRRHQRQHALWRRSAACAASDPRARAVDAGRDRPLFPRRRQRGRAAVPGARRD